VVVLKATGAKMLDWQSWGIEKNCISGAQKSAMGSCCFEVSRTSVLEEAESVREHQKLRAASSASQQELVPPPVSASLSI
jgi:hypothetical protein